MSASIALASGFLAMCLKKGAKGHILSGMIFYYAMLVCIPLAWIIAISPGHVNPFLFAIGIFSIYFVIAGKRSLKHNKKDINLGFDRFLAGFLLMTGLAMVIVPFVLGQRINWVLLVFGVVAIVFGISDWRLFSNIDKLKKNALKNHIAKMTGAYIAAVTAFFVTVNALPSLLNWFLPGVLGSIFITLWVKKYGHKYGVA